MNIFILKMAAKNTKNDRVGSLDIVFQQVPLVHNFRKLRNIVME